MAQNTHGIRAALSAPSVYNAFQNLVGAGRARRIIVAEYVRAVQGNVIVDVGCGTAEILDHLPPVTYHGFDLSERYIESARARHGDRAEFHCADITAIPEGHIPSCDIAIAIGLLHHLDDSGARKLIEHLHSRLSKGGRLVTVDPAYWPGQSKVAHYLVSSDRGQNVREDTAYRDLAVTVFNQVSVVRRGDLLNIPYSHAILECIK
jgi:SAM-dependent methyltransferase